LFLITLSIGGMSGGQLRGRKKRKKTKNGGGEGEKIYSSKDYHATTGSGNTVIEK